MAAVTAQSRDTRAEVVDLNTRFQKNIQETKQDLDTNIQVAFEKCSQNLNKILDVERELKESIKQMERNSLIVSENSQRCLKMEVHKLDAEVYKKEKALLDDEIERNRLAIRDNFGQLLATDNFLEKYLPFRIQNLISESVLSLLGDGSGSPARTMRLDSDAARRVERFRQQCVDRYKSFEYKAYKRLHRVVISDEGIPTLKKRAYKIPGYRKVLASDERVIYEQVLDK